MTDAGSGCIDGGGAPWWYCPAITGYRINLGDQNDQLFPNQYGATFGCCSPPDIPITVDGGPGVDSVVGGLAGDQIDGGPGGGTARRLGRKRHSHLHGP